MDVSSANTKDNLDHDILDIDFISSQSSTSSSQAINKSTLTNANFKVLAYIDTTLDNVVSALATGLSLEIVLKRPISMERPTQNAGVGDGAVSVQVKHRRVTYFWPGITLSDEWRFGMFTAKALFVLNHLNLDDGLPACLLAILVEVRLAVGKGITVTKRDIYYRQPELFKQQGTVDRLIDDIAFTCDVTRKDLRVSASPKGLLCGLSSNDEVLIVPEDPTIITTATVEHLQWILVVEKEASFKTLVEHAFHRNSSFGRGLIATGKGYPDLNTKQFLRHVLDIMPPQTRIFGLFDGDPDGLDIYRCCRVGSKRLAQEVTSNLPEMKWSGVDIGDFLKYPGVMSEALSLTVRDRSRARGMLRRKDLEFSVRRTTEDTARWRRSLQYMLMLNLKMEIQAVDKMDGGLCGWLTGKMVAS